MVLDESGTDYSRGKVAFTGLNTNFTGKISMTREFYMPGSFERQYMNLYVYDGRKCCGRHRPFHCSCDTGPNERRCSGQGPSSLSVAKCAAVG